jgi:hypothetical protein
MENSENFKTMKRQWNIPMTGSWLDGMKNSEIFKTMKRQWNILITGSWLDGNIVLQRPNSRKLHISRVMLIFLYSFFCCLDQYDNNDNVHLSSQVELGKPLVNQTKLWTTISEGRSGRNRTGVWPLKTIICLEL